MSSSRAKRPVGPVRFVGAGPGDEDLLTLRAAELLAGADVVVADPDIPPGVLAHVRGGAEVSAPEDPAKATAAAARSGRAVVRLVLGDPLLAAGDELEAAAKARLPFEYVPGVPVETAVPGYAGIGLLSRRAGGSLRIVDAGHPRPDWPALAAEPATTVLTGDAAEVAKAASSLVEHGRPADTTATVTSGGASTDQTTLVGTLETVAAEAAGLTGRVVAVVGEAVGSRERLSWFETKPLFGWRVLVPRTKEQAASLSVKLHEHGAVPVEVPTIAVEPPRTPAPMDRAVRGLVSGRYQWVVFTSTNAVRAVREKFEELGLDCRAFAGIKVACVGEQTAAAVTRWGIRPELVPTGEQTSEGVLADFPAYDDVFDPIDRVLLPRADIATDTLLAGLKELGWACDDVTAYRTVRAAPPPADIRDAIKGGGFDAVLFTSSSTVRNLVGIAGKPHSSTVIAVIGPQTAKTAEELGLRVDVHAETPSVASLVDGLAAFARARRDAGAPGRPGARARQRPPARGPR